MAIVVFEQLVVVRPFAIRQKKIRWNVWTPSIVDWGENDLQEALNVPNSCELFDVVLDVASNPSRLVQFPEIGRETVH
ncbi:hypothetical protein M514_01479 [Trichuris suis]|uniref:Uncharacterized protein n=1 Tax=Trichuris suis TaxID=68888 RepID=A0A085NI91_9BILA|nr:hypothetical protein M514_01479 [Trichuris suis]